jgi:hypothetical protein
LGADGQWTIDNGSGYMAAWKKLLDAGKKVIAIDDVPGLPMDFADCLALNRGKVESCAYQRPVAMEPSPYAKAVAKMASHEIVLINLTDILCDKTKCYPVVGGIPVYMDTRHVSAPFARSMAYALRNAIAKIGD